MCKVLNGALCAGPRECPEGNAFGFTVDVFKCWTPSRGSVWVRICCDCYSDEWLWDEYRKFMGGMRSSTAFVGVIVVGSLTSVIFFFFLFLWVRVGYHLLTLGNLTLTSLISGFTDFNGHRSVCTLLLLTWGRFSREMDIIIYLCTITIEFLSLTGYIHTWTMKLMHWRRP